MITLPQKAVGNEKKNIFPLEEINLGMRANTKLNKMKDTSINLNRNMKINMKIVNCLIINLKIQEYSMIQTAQKSLQSDQLPICQKKNIFSMN